MGLRRSPSGVSPRRFLEAAPFRHVCISDFDAFEWNRIYKERNFKRKWLQERKQVKFKPSRNSSTARRKSRWYGQGRCQHKYNWAPTIQAVCTMWNQKSLCSLVSRKWAACSTCWLAMLVLMHAASTREEKNAETIWPCSIVRKGLYKRCGRIHDTCYILPHHCDAIYIENWREAIHVKLPFSSLLINRRFSNAEQKTFATNCQQALAMDLGFFHTGSSRSVILINWSFIFLAGDFRQDARMAVRELRKGMLIQSHPYLGCSLRMVLVGICVGVGTKASSRPDSLRRC